MFVSEEVKALRLSLVVRLCAIAEELERSQDSIMVEDGFTDEYVYLGVLEEPINVLFESFKELGVVNLRGEPIR